LFGVVEEVLQGDPHQGRFAQGVMLRQCLQALALPVIEPNANPFVLYDIRA